MNESVIIDIMIAFILKKDILKESIVFFDELITRYKKGSHFFKYSQIKSKFKQIGYVMSYMNGAGILEKYNKHTWKIVDFESLKRIYLFLQMCYVDENEYQRALTKYSGDLFVNGLQKLMYKVGRLIAEKEQCDVIDAITSILIAYYVENYGEDDKIKEIIKNVKMLKRLATKWSDNHE